jgi:hypothetical protein
MRRIVVCLLFGLIVVSVQGAAQKPITVGRSVCVPYDPSTLELTEIGSTGTWRLQRNDGAIFEQFADREDAEAGLEVAKRHTQICYIGKSNTRPNRDDYVMTYWR